MCAAGHCHCYFPFAPAKLYSVSFTLHQPQQSRITNIQHLSATTNNHLEYLCHHFTCLYSSLYFYDFFFLVYSRGVPSELSSCCTIFLRWLFLLRSTTGTKSNGGIHCALTISSQLAPHPPSLSSKQLRKELFASRSKRVTQSQASLNPGQSSASFHDVGGRPQLQIK